MSEEEKKIIQPINNFLMYCRGFEERKFTDRELFEAMENVYDLIKKQQKEIEKLKEKNNQKYYHTIKCRELEKEINKEWEDKIRAEIKQLELMILHDDDIFGQMRDFAILMLKELLEENNNE